MTDYTAVVDGRCQHGKELRTVWCRPLGEMWQLLGQFKCEKCPTQVSIRMVHEKPTKVLTTQGKQFTAKADA